MGITRITLIHCAVIILQLLESNKNLLSGCFLAYQLKLNFYKKYFGSHANGSTRYGLSTQSINNTFLAIPTIVEQKGIIERLETLRIKIKSEIEILNKYLKIKHGLMQDLLTGKKRVKLDEHLEELRGIE